MPTINFPSGPSLNDTYNLGVRTWKWNGEAWALQPLTGGFTGSQGYTGSTGIVAPLTIDTTNNRVGINQTSPATTLEVRAAIPKIRINDTDGSDLITDLCGAAADFQIKFKGENDADQEVIYAKITAKISDASDGTEDGILEFTHKKAGANNISARWKSDKLMLINGTGLEVAGDITLSTVNNTTNIQIKDSSGNVLKTMYGTTS